MSNHGLNHVMLIGYVGKDPVVSSEGKKSFASVSLATSEVYKANGETIEKTTWHNLVFFNGTAEIVKKHVRKGARLHIQGKLENQQWEDKNGNKRVTTNIVVHELILLDLKNKANDVNESNQ